MATVGETGESVVRIYWRRGRGRVKYGTEQNAEEQCAHFWVGSESLVKILEEGEG